MTTEYLLNEQMELVLQLLTPENRLVMRVALHTGLRVGDVLNLTPDRLKPNCWVTEQKTGKRRQIGLPEPLLSDLRANANEYWVFPSPADPHKHRTRQGVWKDVKRAAAACRLPQNIAPHSARKCYAVGLMDKYGDIGRVQKALNHSSAEVTMLYACADKLLEQKNRRRRRRSGKRLS